MQLYACHPKNDTILQLFYDTININEHLTESKDSPDPELHQRLEQFNGVLSVNSEVININDKHYQKTVKEDEWNSHEVLIKFNIETEAALLSPEEQDDCNIVVQSNIGVKEESLASEDSADRELDQQLFCTLSESVSDDRLGRNALDKNESDTNSQEFQCSMCEEDFINKSTLNTHLINHIKNMKDLECTMCSKRMSKRCNLIQYMKVHLGIKEFECLICTRMFGRKDHLEKHLEHHLGDSIHIKEEFIEYEDNSDREYYKQLVCTFSESVSDDEQDDGSSVTSADNSGLDKNETNTDRDNQEFQCSMCNEGFPVKTTLDLHLLNHIKTLKGLECPICKNKISQRSNLIEHMKLHLDIKEFECLICKKMFGRKDHMQKHMKHHLSCQFDIKQFKCSICSKTFVDSSSLKVHLNNHLGIKDHECTICSNKLVHNSKLRRHIIFHLGIKDFECSVCNKTFAQNCQLKTHMKLHFS